MIQVLVNEFMANVLFSEVAGSAKDLLELLGLVDDGVQHFLQVRAVLRAVIHSEFSILVGYEDMNQCRHGCQIDGRDEPRSKATPLPIPLSSPVVMSFATLVLGRELVGLLVLFREALRDVKGYYVVGG